MDNLLIRLLGRTRRVRPKPNATNRPELLPHQVKESMCADVLLTVSMLDSPVSVSAR
jgi:hypothetical protein